MDEPRPRTLVHDSDHVSDDSVFLFRVNVCLQQIDLPCFVLYLKLCFRQRNVFSTQITSPRISLGDPGLPEGANGPM